MLNITTATNKTKLVTKTGFRNYDITINPYVGCQFGCKYCYVRFTVKDKNHQWGEYQSWKDKIKDRWCTAWTKFGNKSTLATWLDHQQHIAIDMNTNKDLDWKHYGEDSGTDPMDNYPLI